MTTFDRMSIERPFNWGVVLVSDKTTDDIPGPSEGGFSASTTALAIAVRHAQDVDIDTELGSDDVVPPFLVRVVVQRGRAPEPSAFSCEISVPSGTLSIGDAEDEAMIDVEPGNYRIEVAVDPVDHPERVRIWWSSGD